MNSRKQKLLAVSSMVGFVVLWAVVTDAWNYSAILSSARTLYLWKYFYGYISRIVWMLPAFILICRFDKELFWSRKQLFSGIKAEPVFIAFIILTAVYTAITMAVNYI